MNTFGQQVFKDLNGPEATVVLVFRYGVDYRLATIPLGVIQGVGVGAELIYTLDIAVHPAVDLQCGNGIRCEISQCVFGKQAQLVECRKGGDRKNSQGFVVVAVFVK